MNGFDNEKICKLADTTRCLTKQKYPIDPILIAKAMDLEVFTAELENKLVNVLVIF